MDIGGAAAVVTGGAGGLGEATVRRLAGRGCHVVVADLAEEKGRALAGELGGAATFVRTDATSEEDVQEAIEAAVAHGPLRVAVAVHGGFGAGGRTVRQGGAAHSLDDFRRVVDHYLVGTFNVLRLTSAAIAATPESDTGEHGVVVLTASIAAFEGTIGQVAYASAKGGVVAMTLPAARDLAVLGVRVVTIAPGTMRTPAYGPDLDQVEAHWAPAVPFPRRMGRPDEYGQLVLSICDNPYLNGEVVRLDGALRFTPRGAG
ncbi:MAG: SDR family NAD(P)-dependent oxidoreductase [Acidimicrobiales bacterium]